VNGRMYMAYEGMAEIYIYDRSGTSYGYIMTEYSASALAGDDCEPLPDKEEDGGSNSRLFAVSNGQIREIDPDGGATIQGFTPPEAPDGSNDGLAYDGRHLYYNRGGSPKIWRINPDTGATVTSYTVTAGSGSYTGLAVLGGNIYVLDEMNDAIHVVNPASGQVTNTLDVSSIGASTLDALAGMADPARLLLYTYSGMSEIYEVNPLDGTLYGPLMMSDTYTGGAVVNGRMYMAYEGMAEIYIYDRSGTSYGYIMTEYSASALAGDDCEPLPDKEEDGGSNSRLFAVSNGQIREIDPDGGATIQGFTPPEAPDGSNDGLAYDGRHLYYISGNSTKIWRLIPDTGATVASYTVTAGSGSYKGLAVLGGNIYVLDESDDAIHVVNASSGQVTNSLDVSGLGAFTLDGLAGMKDPARVLLYVDTAMHEIYEVNPIDGTTYGPFSVSYQYTGGAVVNGRIYLAYSGSSEIHIYDRSGASYGSLSMSNPASALAGDDSEPLPDKTAESATSTTSALVGHWKLDETSGPTVTDSAGSHDGTAYDTITYSQAGAIGDAFLFDGTSAYVSVPSTAAINPTERITVSCWARSPTGTWNTTAPLVDKDQSYSLYVGGASNAYFAVVVGGSTYTANIASGVDITQWHLYTGTYDGYVARLYVDGAEIATAAPGTPGPLDSNANDILFAYDGTTANLNAYMDDVRIYDTVLGPSMIEDMASMTPSDSTSSLWFSGTSMRVLYMYDGMAAVSSNTPGSNNYGMLYLTGGPGGCGGMLPLQGLPQSVKGVPVKIRKITVYFKTDTNETIEETQVFIGSATVYSDTDVRSSATLASYAIALDEPITGDVQLAVQTYHDGSGDGNSVDIARVRVDIEY